MTEIPVYRHKAVVAYAIADDSDADWLNQWTWRLTVDERYAVRTLKTAQGTLNVMMHRLILGLSHDDPRETDHINRNSLDNRRTNLRAVTKAQNQQNRGLFYRGRSHFRGVDFKGGKWRARVTIDQKQHHVGYFATEQEAAQAAHKFRRAHMPFSQFDQEVAA